MTETYQILMAAGPDLAELKDTSYGDLINQTAPTAEDFIVSCGFMDERPISCNRKYESKLAYP